jgi:hypothetical protein
MDATGGDRELFLMSDLWVLVGPTEPLAYCTITSSAGNRPTYKYVPLFTDSDLTERQAEVFRADGIPCEPRFLQGPKAIADAIGNMLAQSHVLISIDPSPYRVVVCIAEDLMRYFEQVQHSPGTPGRIRSNRIG